MVLIKTKGLKWIEHEKLRRRDNHYLMGILGDYK